MIADDSLDLYWIPLGAGARVVRISGWTYEALRSTLRRTRRCDLYHAALIATVDGVGTIVEVAPIPDGAGRQSRGVVAEGPVGSRRLGNVRLFRYEVRRWTGGVIPDLTYAVASPVQITGETGEIRHALDLLGRVPTPVWGRDELGTGDMWNSNSVVSWTLCRAGLLDAAGEPPPRGRAPGWDAGVEVARSGRQPTQPTVGPRPGQSVLEG